MSSADNKWENQMTPEEKKASRRARRQRLGADLFETQVIGREGQLIAADLPSFVIGVNK